MGAVHSSCATLKASEKAVDAVAVSPDGKTLAVGSSDNRVSLWSVKKKHSKLIQTLGSHSHYVLCCDFSSDGQILASASADGTVRLWSMQTRAQIGVLKGHTDWCFCCVFSHDGSLLASGSGDGTVRLWSLADFQCIAVLHGHSYWVRGCQFSRDGRLLLSCAADGTARVWNVMDHSCIGIIKTRASQVLTCALSPDERWIATAGSDSCVHLWDATTLKFEKTLIGHLNVCLCALIALLCRIGSYSCCISSVWSTVGKRFEGSHAANMVIENHAMCKCIRRAFQLGEVLRI